MNKIDFKLLSLSLVLYLIISFTDSAYSNTLSEIKIHYGDHKNTNQSDENKTIRDNFFTALYKKDFETIKKLITTDSIGGYLKSEEGSHILHHQSVSLTDDNLETIKLLTAYGAKVLSKDRDGNSLLYRVSDPEVAQYLINNGLNVNATNLFGKAPIHYAAFRGNKKIIDLFLQNKADINVVTETGETALHISTIGSLSMYTRMPSPKALANTYRIDYEYFLNQGIPHFLETVEFLLSSGADTSIQTKNRKTALQKLEEQEKIALASSKEIKESEEKIIREYVVKIKKLYEIHELE